MRFWCAPVGALLVRSTHQSVWATQVGFCGCMGLLPDNTYICMKLKRISCTKYSGYRVRSVDC